VATDDLYRQSDIQNNLFLSKNGESWAKNGMYEKYTSSYQLNNRNQLITEYK
jgi:hypothetical protein